MNRTSSLLRTAAGMAAACLSPKGIAREVASSDSPLSRQLWRKRHACASSLLSSLIPKFTSLSRKMFEYFKRKKKQEEILRHVAGATVVHKNPFEKLEPPFKTKNLSQDFINEWIAPFYMERLLDSDNYKNKFLEVKDHLTPEVVKQLLGYFDWRSRITGAYFSTIMNYTEFENFIGIHLIKSEVCYAGEGYLIALSSFNTNKSIEYLVKYLDYYLSKPDLWFDQGDAMAALIWLDNKNRTTLVKDNNYLAKWTEFISNKPNWNLNHYIDFFNRRMAKILEIKEKVKDIN